MDNMKQDRISQLPDELLGSILSHLSINEAAQTSVFSPRWRSVWTLFNGNLKFYDFTTGSIKHQKHERTKYINWVNQVLTSLNVSSSSNIDEFIVRHHPDDESRRHVNRWVLFALKIRAKRIELDMRVPLLNFKRYTLPLEFSTYISQPRGLSNVSCLTSLCLKYVDISEEVIMNLLSNYALLERLCVWSSEQLTSLKVVGDIAATLQLKYLEISNCSNLKCLEISAPNLVSFNYAGLDIDLRFENNPKLVEVSIDVWANINSIGLFSSYYFQIESLKLYVNNMKDYGEFRQHLALKKVKHLTLQIMNLHNESLLEWTSVISSSPFLHKLTLQMITFGSQISRKMQKVTGGYSNHECLKVVELVGFDGSTTDLEVIMYLVASCSALHKIIVDCRSGNYCGSEWEAGMVAEAKLQGYAVENLKEILPSNVELVLYDTTS